MHTLLPLLLLLLPLAAQAQPRPRQVPPCTLYASPPGTGTACSQTSPCTVQEGVARLGPGKTLCLLDGLYTGSSSMLSAPSSLQGTREQPIWIRALREGSVVLDGQDSRRPIQLHSQYVRVVGLDVTRGDNQTIGLYGAYNVVRRVVAYDAGEDGDGQITIGGSSNTLEDCVALGPARKQIPVGSSTPGPGNVVRRCFASWASNPHPTSNPSNTMEMGYGQDDVTFEQNILTWNTMPGGRVTSPEGLLQIFSTRRSRVVGNLFLVPASAALAPGRLVAAWNDAGSHAQQGDYHNTQDLDFRYNVAMIDPQHPRFADIQAYYFAESTDGAPPGTGNQIRDSVGVSGQPNVFSTQSWLPPTGMQWGTTLAQAIGSGKSLWTQSVAAPGICTRLSQGQATPVGLWPFVMQARLDTAATRWGLPRVDVTAMVEALLGPIPDQCRWDRTPVPPEPTPTPPTTVTLQYPAVTLPAMTCTGTPDAVTGVTALTCAPKEGSR